MRKWIASFLLAFLLNIAWENIHKFLYLHYKGGEITQFILARAALADAAIILMVLFIASYLRKHYRSYAISVLGIAAAIMIERYALFTGRWSYNELMPVIPVLSIGLTPAIQLWLTGLAVYWLIMNKKQNMRRQ